MFKKPFTIENYSKPILREHMGDGVCQEGYSTGHSHCTMSLLIQSAIHLILPLQTSGVKRPARSWETGVPKSTHSAQRISKPKSTLSKVSHEESVAMVAGMMSALDDQLTAVIDGFKNKGLCFCALYTHCGNVLGFCSVHQLCVGEYLVKITPCKCLDCFCVYLFTV